MAVGAWSAGQRILASRLNLITATWSAWNPVWSTTTGANIPTIGTGVYDCDYTQTGDLVVARFEVVFGSTTTFGSTDNWTWSLPVAAAGTVGDVGTGKMQQSNPIRAHARCRLNSPTVFMLEIDTGRPDATAITSTGIADAAAPWTWASGHSIRALLNYRAA